MAFSQDLKTRLTTALAEQAAATELETAISAAASEISDVAYNSTTWDAVTTIGASKNALRDKFVLVDAADALKAPAASPTFTGTTTFSALTLSTVPYLDASKALVSSAVTPTQLGYVAGVTSAIQTQINTKLTATQAANVPALAGTLTGTVDGTITDVAAIALSTGGGNTYSDAAVNTAVNTAITALNAQLKELQATLNLEIAALKLTNIQAAV